MYLYHLFNNHWRWGSCLVWTGTEDSICAHSVSCAQCCLCPWIVLRVSLTFIEVSSEPARSFLQLNGLLIFFHSSLPSTYTSNSVVPQGVLAPIFTNVGVLCSCSNHRQHWAQDTEWAQIKGKTQHRKKIKMSNMDPTKQGVNPSARES
jgi:hypothetical protein